MELIFACFWDGDQGAFFHSMDIQRKASSFPLLECRQPHKLDMCVAWYPDYLLSLFCLSLHGYLMVLIATALQCAFLSVSFTLLDLFLSFKTTCFSWPLAFSYTFYYPLSIISASPVPGVGEAGGKDAVVWIGIVLTLSINLRRLESLQYFICQSINTVLPSNHLSQL